jgi:hypothetical protein
MGYMVEKEGNGSCALNYRCLAEYISCCTQQCYGNQGKFFAAALLARRSPGKKNPPAQAGLKRPGKKFRAIVSIELSGSNLHPRRLKPFVPFFHGEQHLIALGKFVHRYILKTVCMKKDVEFVIGDDKTIGFVGNDLANNP